MILKKLAKKMGTMRLEDLAYKTRLSMSTIEKAKKGGKVKESTAQLIAMGLGVEVKDLL